MLGKLMFITERNSFEVNKGILHNLCFYLTMSDGFYIEFIRNYIGIMMKFQ